jgi:serine/threonine protein kinase
MLGTGATSAVDEVSDSKHPGQVLARKKIAHGRTSKRFTFAKVAREIMLLKKLRHPHIVKLVDSYTTPTSTELLMSPVADCDLATFMKSCAQDTGNDYVCDSSTINRMGSWIGCLSSALAYMHGEGVIHGDLKPQNVLVKGSRVWLADFGIAMAENSRDTSKDFSMTPMYCAREVWSRSCRGRPADIWSFGCVILEMCACMAGKSIQNLQESQTIGRSKPYHEDIQATLRWLELLRLFFEYFEHLRSVTYILGAVASMLLADPQARATADEVRGQLAPNNCCRQLLDHVSHTSDRKTPSGFLWENKFEEGFNGCVLDENYRSGYDVDGPQPSTHSGCHKIGAYPRSVPSFPEFASC